MFIFLYTLFVVMVVCMSDETAEKCESRYQDASLLIRDKKIADVKPFEESRNVSREFCLRRCCKIDTCNAISFNQDADESDNNCFLYSCEILPPRYDDFEGVLSYYIIKHPAPPTTIPPTTTIPQTTTIPPDTEKIQKEIDTFGGPTQNEGVISDQVVEIINGTDIIQLDATTKSTTTKPASTHSSVNTTNTKTAHESSTSLKPSSKTVDKSTVNLALKSTNTVSSPFIASPTSTTHKSIGTSTSNKKVSPTIPQSSVKTVSSKANVMSSPAKDLKTKNVSTENSLTSPIKHVFSNTTSSSQSLTKSSTIKSSSESTLKPMTKSVSNNTEQTVHSDEAQTQVAQSTAIVITKDNQTETKSDQSSDRSKSAKSTSSTHSTTKIPSTPSTSPTTTTISTRTKGNASKSMVKPETTESSGITQQSQQDLATAFDKVLEMTSMRNETDSTTAKKTTNNLLEATTIKSTTEPTKKVTIATLIKTITEPIKKVTEATITKNATVAVTSSKTATNKTTTTAMKTATSSKPTTEATTTKTGANSTSVSTLNNNQTKAGEETGDIMTLQNFLNQTLDQDITYKSEVEQRVIVVTPSSESADIIIPTINNITLNQTNAKITQQIVRTDETSEKIEVPPAEITVINNTLYLGDVNVTYADSNQLLKEKKESHVLSGALIATLSFGILFFFAVLVLIGKRCFDSWQRRHYSRVDYLVNGMYN